MSKYIETLKNGLILEAGYDRPMDYVFVQVIKNGEYLYSNINDSEIDFTCQTDFSHFDKKISKLGIQIPEELKIRVLLDRADFIKSLKKIPNQICAYHNEDLIGADDGRNFGVEIYQEDGEDSGTEALDYEFFRTESEALTRINQINGAFIDDVDDL